MTDRPQAPAARVECGGGRQAEQHRCGCCVCEWVCGPMPRRSATADAAELDRKLDEAFGKGVIS